MKRLLGLVMAVLISFFLVKPAAEPNISLPRPSRLGSGSLEQALERAETVRDYSDQPLSLLQVSTILWAAGGRRYDSETGASRTYPSAGGIYPLELYLVAGAVEGLPAGVYRYLWRSHELERLKQGDVRRALALASLLQGFVSRAPASVVLAADFEKTAAKYGERGKSRYVPLDAGHASQNLRLAASALGLGVGIVGAFEDNAVKNILGIKEEPLLILPLGRPR